MTKGAEIHVLPIRLQGGDQVGRLIADLTAMQAQGFDLGSRVPHIQAAGARLAELSEKLECAVGGMHQDLRQLGVQGEHAQAVIQHLLVTVQKLIDSTQNFPNTA